MMTVQKETKREYWHPIPICWKYGDYEWSIYVKGHQKGPWQPIPIYGKADDDNGLHPHVEGQPIPRMAMILITADSIPNLNITFNPYGKL